MMVGANVNGGQVTLNVTTYSEGWYDGPQGRRRQERVLREVRLDHRRQERA